MSEIKVNLIVTLLGGVMISEQECSKKNSKKNYDSFFLEVEGKNKKKEILNIKTRKCVSAKQSIKISREAYDYMLSTPTNPKLSKVWKRYKDMDRIKQHCKIIADDLGAIDFNFEILDD